MLRIGVLCSGDLGLDTLIKIAQDYTIEFVLTDSNSSAILGFVKQNNIPFYSGNPRKGKGYNFIKEYNIDVIASINYLFLIEEDVINHSNILTFNIHGSLLPKYRGRTPHVWAIINGETKAGITAHIIDSGCDTGKIIHQVEIPIEFEDTGAIMLEKYANEYYPIIKKVLSDAIENKLNVVEQNEENATYFGKRTPADGEIDWNWSKERINNWIRAQANPYPGAFTFYEEKKIIIDKVAYSDSDVGFDNVIENGTILQVSPKLVIKTSNGALSLENIRGEKCIFGLGKKMDNENRK